VQSFATLAADVLQLSGLLAGDVKESRNDSPTRDLQMAADRTRMPQWSQSKLCITISPESRMVKIIERGGKARLAASTSFFGLPSPPVLRKNLGKSQSA
jgi:hypothetical protein